MICTQKNKELFSSSIVCGAYFYILLKNKNVVMQKIDSALNTEIYKNLSMQRIKNLYQFIGFYKIVTILSNLITLKTAIVFEFELYLIKHCT